MKNKFKILAKGKTADIYLYDTIGDSWFGGISAKSFSEELKELKSVDTLNIYINSDGGNVFDGLSIYNQLKRHKAIKHVEVDGLAASIASVIAMAADPGELLIAENAMMMIHNPWGLVMGYADEMRDYADTLDKVRDSILGTYMARSGSDEKMISDLMNEESWLTADEAVDYGFADVLTEEKQMAACVNLSKFGYKNIPKELPSAIYTVDPDQKFPIRKKYKDMIKRGFA